MAGYDNWINGPPSGNTPFQTIQKFQRDDEQTEGERRLDSRNFASAFFDSKIRDGVSAIVYHATDIRSCWEMLRTNRFELTTQLGTPSDIHSDKFYYFSVSRIYFGGYVRSLSKENVVVFVLDGRKFNQRYKGGPVDYWGPEWRKGSATTEQKLRNDENEERIFTDDATIPNALKYILEVHVCVGDDPDPENAYEVLVNHSEYFEVQRINEFCNKHGIKTAIYTNYKAFTLHDTRRALTELRGGRTGYIDAILAAIKTDDIDSLPDGFPWDAVKNGLHGYYEDDLITQLKNDIHNYRAKPEYRDTIAELTKAMRKMGVRTIEDLIKALQQKFYPEEKQDRLRYKGKGFTDSLIEDRKAQVTAYHGTTDRFFREILKKGMVPDPGNRTWKEDPQASLGQQSRVSLPGSYWTTNLMTAISSATNTTKKFGGDPIIIVANLMPESGVGDEDDINFKFEYSIRQAFTKQRVIPQFDDPRGLGTIWGAIVDDPGLIGKVAREVAEDLHLQWAENPEKKPMPVDMYELWIDAYIKRQIAYVLPIKEEEASSVLYEWKRGYGQYYPDEWDDIPLPDTISGGKAKAEKELLEVRNRVTTYYRELALEMRSEGLGGTMRITLPVTFRGRNRIVTIIRRTESEEEKYAYVLEAVYGDRKDLPRDFEKQWEARVGEVRWVA